MAVEGPECQRVAPARLISDRTPRHRRSTRRCQRTHMPTYQYACTECGHSFEQFQSFSEDALTVCPECDGKLRKLYNAVGVVFKGSGFYRTDSRSGSSSATPAATPASTGMCRPVVWLSWSVQRTKTALAMLSGSTSRLRIVRWA
mgnify:CR=1 FL=1